MKKLMPILTAGAMVFASGAPIFAAEEDAPTGDTGTTPETPDKDTTTGENTGGDTGKDETTGGDTTGGDTTGGDENKGDAAGDAQETQTMKDAKALLEQLKAVDTKGFTEEQKAKYDELLTALDTAITTNDEKAMNTAITAAQELLDLIAPSEGEAAPASEEQLKAAQDMLDRASVALKLNSAKWTKEQTEEVTALCSLLQTAVTNKDGAAIEENMNKVNEAFLALGVDLSKITEEDVEKAKGTPNSQASTGLGAAGTAAAAIMSLATVTVGGLTFRNIRRRG